MLCFRRPDAVQRVSWDARFLPPCLNLDGLPLCLDPTVHVSLYAQIAHAWPVDVAAGNTPRQSLLLLFSTVPEGLCRLLESFSCCCVYCSRAAHAAFVLQLRLSCCRGEPPPIPRVRDITEPAMAVCRRT